MKKHVSFAGAALLAVAALAWAQNAPSDKAMDKSMNKEAAVAASNAQPIGQFKDADGIRWTLRTITEAALTKGGFDDVVKRLSDADRNRIGQTKPTSDELAVLDGIIADISNAWKEKYHDDFKVKDEKAVYNDQFAMVEAGEMGSNARLASEQEKNATDPNAKASDKNLEPGRDVATVVLAPANGLPALTIPVIKEAGLTGKWWEINAPDTLDGAKLRANLQKQLTEIKDSKDKWPADPNDAYRIVTQHVIAAVLDADLNKAGTAPADVAPLPAAK